MPPPPLDMPWLAWLLLFVTFGPPAIVSKTAAKAPSFLGAIARWYQSRKPGVAEVVTAANLNEVVEKMVEKKIGKVMQEVDLLAGYLAYDASWHRVVEIHAGKEGWQFPHPVHKTYTDWLNEQGISYPLS